MLILVARLAYEFVLVDLPHAVDSLHRKHGSWLWMLALTQLNSSPHMPFLLNQHAWTTIIQNLWWSYGILLGSPVAYSCLPKGAGLLNFILAT